MFERWPERRRRWFLLTFCGVVWALFLNSFAHLGDEFARGGVGPDATHAASIFGTLGVWTVAIGAFHLHLRHWVFAVLCGVAVSSAMVDFGLRDHAAAFAWSVACDRGEGGACRELARYYEAGNSPVHGWSDAERLHHTACERGVWTSCVSTAPASVSEDDACALYQDVRACHGLLNSGYPDRRLVACDVLEAQCTRSAKFGCFVVAARCERARSPRAGNN